MNQLTLTDDMSASPSPYPFSFLYHDKASAELLPTWRKTRHETALDEERTRITTVWSDPATGLQLTWEATQFRDFPAMDWVLYFANTGSKDTPILEEIKALDLLLDAPLWGTVCYRLYRTNGAPANPMDYTPTTVDLPAGALERLSAAGGTLLERRLPVLQGGCGGLFRHCGNRLDR